MDVLLAIVLGLSPLGVGLAMFAGAQQGWREEQGLDVSDVIFLLVWEVPWSLTVKALLWHIPATLGLHALAGTVAGCAVGGVRSLSWAAERTSRGLLAATGPARDDISMIEFLKEDTR